jgi:hypothetical protein
VTAVRVDHRADERGIVDPALELSFERLAQADEDVRIALRSKAMVRERVVVAREDELDGVEERPVQIEEDCFEAAQFGPAAYL